LAWPSGGRSARGVNLRNALIFLVRDWAEVPLVREALTLAVEQFNAPATKCSYLKQQVSRIFRILNRE
jgi:hypothetical protein